MPRTGRGFGSPGACFHVLNRGQPRETIFHDDDDRLHFLRLLTRYRDRFHLPGMRILQFAFGGAVEPRFRCGH